MAIQKYVSDIKTVNWDNKIVYEKLSDLTFLNFMFSPENIERAKQQIGDDRLNDFKVENFYADRDSCKFDIKPVGSIGLKIINRDEPKTIKIINSDSTPVKFTIWIQMLPVKESKTKMRVTIHLDLNMMMKMMLGKKLNGIANQIADGLAQIPYGLMPSSY